MQIKAILEEFITYDKRLQSCLISNVGVDSGYGRQISKMCPKFLSPWFIQSTTRPGFDM